MRFLLILFLISLEAKALTVTSLNLQWFGRGGIKEGTVDDEFRGKRLRDFLYNRIPQSEVYVFQEVTSPALIKKVFHDLNCGNYINSVERHQHVMICHQKNISSQFDANHEVQLGNPHMRAGMISNLNLGNGQMVKIIGLHLKAGRDKTEYRKKQLTQLGPDLTGSVATIVIGDFNAYPKDRTLLEKDDEEIFSDLLTPFGLIKSPIDYKTYLWREKRIFDLAWYKNLNLKSAAVFGPCRLNSVAYPYSSHDFFRRFVSDHCAIQVSFE